ncbi:hypothetical protein C0993_004480 [Termitomyces sp. T159_Od127]|nr:hypothetical protein C0993_004480 [Termitomyces sp. T159_Od127]
MSNTFIGLNGVRALSIIALILVFASNIVTLVHDIEAVNRFVAADNSGSNSTVTASGSPNSTVDMSDMGYIMYDLSLLTLNVPYLSNGWV